MCRFMVFAIHCIDKQHDIMHNIAVVTGFNLRMATGTGLQVRHHLLMPVARQVNPVPVAHG